MESRGSPFARREGPAAVKVAHRGRQAEMQMWRGCSRSRASIFNDANL
jgi:hypothetical protein